MLRGGGGGVERAEDVYVDEVGSFADVSGDVEEDGLSANGVDAMLIGVISVTVCFWRHICFVLGVFRRGIIGLAAAIDCLSKRIKKSRSLYFYQN
jgi:hypothetical protein